VDPARLTVTRFPGRAALLLGLVALVGVLCALVARHGCTHMPPPLGAVSPPDPGTPRAGFCDTVEHGVPWLLPLLSVAVAAPLLALTRRRDERVGAALVGLVCAADLAVAVLAGSLDAALTI
jgi:hypothetical protein